MSDRSVTLTADLNKPVATNLATKMLIMPASQATIDLDACEEESVLQAAYSCYAK